MKNSKWFNNPKIVDALLFILPPMGIYGLYKTEAMKTKINKAAYRILGFISFLLLLISLN